MKRSLQGNLLKFTDTMNSLHSDYGLWGGDSINQIIRCSFATMRDNLDHMSNARRACMVYDLEMHMGSPESNRIIE